MMGISSVTVAKEASARDGPLNVDPESIAHLSSILETPDDCQATKVNCKPQCQVWIGNMCRLQAWISQSFVGKKPVLKQHSALTPFVETIQIICERNNVFGRPRGSLLAFAIPCGHRPLIWHEIQRQYFLVVVRRHLK